MKSPFERIQWNCSGSEIEQESFRRIDRETPPALRQRFTDAEWHVARRLIHTTADFAIAEQLRFTPGAIEAALAALRHGARIYTDSNMIKSGLSIPKLQKFHPSYCREAILCPVADPETAEYAKKRGITRALAAVELHEKLQLNGPAVLLLALAGVVRLTLAKRITPALVVAMPVGFVNVVESKEYSEELPSPCIRIDGRRGGSPLAVATLHGIMENAL